MPKIYLTLLMVLVVLSSAAQDDDKKTFKALGTDWSIFGVSLKLGTANNREEYKLNANNLRNVITSDNSELSYFDRALDSATGWGTQMFDNFAIYGNVVFKPLVMSDRKLLKNQEVRVGFGVQQQTYTSYVQWITESGGDRFSFNSFSTRLWHTSYYIDPSWIIRTNDVGENLVFYSGLGIRFAMAGNDDINTHYSTADYDKINGSYEQVTNAVFVNQHHNFKPHTTLMYYVPLGLKKYISCRLNFIAEAYYGRGTTYVKEGGNWNFESSGFQFGLQYKFQKPVKLDGEKQDPNKGGVFW